MQALLALGLLLLLLGAIIALLPLIPTYGLGSHARGATMLAEVESDPWSSSDLRFYTPLRFGGAVMHSWTEDSHASWSGGQALVVDPADGEGLVVYGHICGALAMVGEQSDFVGRCREAGRDPTIAGFLAHLKERYPDHQAVHIELPAD